MERDLLEKLFDKWCKKLRVVPAWDVKLEIVTDPAWRKTGDIKIDCDDRKAVLLLNGVNPKQENMEEVIVHELFHLKMYPLDQTTESLIESCFEENSPAQNFAMTQFMTTLEQTVEELAKCFLLEFGENKSFSFGRCASQKSFDTYCEKTGLKDKVVEVAFRYTKGWGIQMASRKHLESTIKPNASKWNCISPRKSYYLRAFTGGLMFDESCYNCHYATPQRVSDLTMADYWGIGTMVPFSHPKKKGISLLLVNSEKGKAVVGECQDLFIVERPFGEAAQGNHNLSQCSDRPQERETYCQDAETMPIDALIKKYRIEPSFKDYLRPLKRRIIK